MLAAHINVLTRWLGISGTWLNTSNTLFGLTISITAALLLRPIPPGPDQYFKVMSFLRSDKVKVSGLARLCRGLKKDRAWEIIWMHPENSMVHETRSMPVC